jgi:chromosome segregation protein
MAYFSRLRLTGFKSFVDKTELEIGSGMTGIVGPNGCGKSNLVEALSWVMGETSAKRLRGSGMDDVIFNGTSSRPMRNSAEVSLVINNHDRTAPALFNTTDEIEVVRRIERDMGSSYYVNGKPVRARDVQMLFADMAIGAHSTAIVSQGRIAAIINAKPSERRQILEESAGVSGLYVRRHEAELRLRAADNNLARLQDVMAGLEQQLDALKRQSRQARRYKDISDSIRTLETMLALAEWNLAQTASATATSTLQSTESLVAEHMTTVAQLTRTQLTQAEDIPPLREKQAETAAAWQVQNFEMKRIDDEEARINAEASEAKQGADQSNADIAHEQQILDESTSTLERITAEQTELESRGDQVEAMERLRTARASQESTLQQAQSAHQDAIEKAANLRAGRSSLQSQLQRDEQQLAHITRRVEELRTQIQNLNASQIIDTDEITQRIADLETQLQTARDDEQLTREQIDTIQQNVETIRSEAEQSRGAVQKIKSEINALESVLAAETQKGFRPILDDVRADEGFETALAKALGDTLMASTDENAPAQWAVSSHIIAPSFPAGVQALAPHIRAPEALKTALSFIGLVEDESQGDALASQLQAGQSLVSRNGAYWRFDGLRMRANSVDRAALRLKNQNRLDELQTQLPALETSAQSLADKLNDAQQALSTARQNFQTAQTKARETDRELSTARQNLQRAVEQNARNVAERAKREETLNLLTEDQVKFTASVEQIRADMAQFDDATLNNHQATIDELRARVQTAQDELQNTLTDLQVLEQDSARRVARLRAIADERVNIQNRTIRARERIKTLTERLEHFSAKVGELSSKPKALQQRRESLLDNLATLENQKNEASDKLAIAERELDQTNKALREAEQTLMTVREARAHAQATLEAAGGSIEIIRQSIMDQFACDPETLWEQSNLTLEKINAEPVDRLRGKRDRLIRERDGMGPVNLRADVEATEVEDQLTKMTNERNDLTQAIEELRQGISKLNKEARERLMTAFHTVNDYFKTLFTRLFGGGSAHLAFIESDDPLEAALEIYAQPPGKTLQSLSLLSGGEKTLASTALLFAMFMTNPAPICVLDEIDAPLDDANVDRVCGLIEEMASHGKTRFIVVTHHRLTMARMNRLYGVTMAERGVSQLVSVDLQQKLEFLEAAE